MTGYENDKQISYIERRIVETNRLMIGEDWALIPYGSAIDLGGCGKGYLADQIGQILDSYPIVGYWLSMGGDIVTKGVDENGNNIILNIQDANNLGGVSEWIVNCPKEYFSVATSGTFKRKHQNIPEGWHHIINPKTQMPAVTDIRLATICADKSVDSDVLASCAIILGSKKAPAFLKKHGAKSALLQCMTSEGLVFEKVFGEQINKIKVSQKV